MGGNLFLDFSLDKVGEAGSDQRRLLSPQALKVLVSDNSHLIFLTSLQEDRTAAEACQAPVIPVGLAHTSEAVWVVCRMPAGLHWPRLSQTSFFNLVFRPPAG